MKSLGFILPAFLVALVFLGSDNPYLPLTHSDSASTLGLLAVLFLVFNLQKLKSKAGETVVLSPLILGLILFLGWLALGYFYTVRLDLSYEWIVKSLFAIPLVLGMVLFLSEKKQVDAILWLLTGCAGLVTVFVICQQVQPSLLKLVEPELSSHSIFENTNIYACYLVIHFPLTVYLFRISKAGLEKAAAGIICILIVENLWFTNSIWGVAVLFGQTLVIGLYLLGKKGWRAAKVLGGTVLVGVGALVVYSWRVGVLAGFPPEVSRRVLIRLEYWQAAWNIFLDHWVKGTGLFTFTNVYPEYRADEFEMPMHVHNLYLQMAAEAGLIGLGLLLFCLGWLGLKMVPLIRNGEHKETVFYLGMALAGFLAHNLIDTFWGNGGLLFYFILLVCLVDFFDRSLNRKPPTGLSHRPALAVVMMVFILLSSWMLVQYYRYATLVNREVFKQPGIEQAESLLNRSASLCPRCSVPYLLLGNFYLIEYRRSPADGYLEKAEAALQTASRMGKYHQQSQLYLSDVRVAQGRLRDAWNLLIPPFQYGLQENAAIGRLQLIAKKRQQQIEEQAKAKNDR